MEIVSQPRKPQTWPPLTITCFDQLDTVWMTSTYGFMKQIIEYIYIIPRPLKEKLKICI